MTRQFHAHVPFRERLFARLVINPDGCLIWTGNKDDGYGRIRRDGRRVYTHVAMYEMFAGPVPDGMQLDHLCRNRACANVAHLEPVLPKENGWRGQGNQSGWSDDACSAGHKMPENARYSPTGGRRCRACFRAWQREYRRRKTRGEGVLIG